MYFGLCMLEGRRIMWKARIKTLRAKIIVGIVSTFYILEALLLGGLLWNNF